jgi:hypothetical protein
MCSDFLAIRTEIGQAQESAVLLTPSRSGEGGRRRQAPLTAEARARRGTAEFLPSFIALQEAVRDACRGQREWEAKVVAGVQATLQFASAHPEMAQALTVNARREPGGMRDPDQEVILYFARLLAKTAKAEREFPISTDENIVNAMATVIRGHLVAGTPEQLPGRASDLVYIALMPRLGLEKTIRWSESLSS